ncbi:MAG TPA: hypothetical protein VK797_22895 [Tepidisphaeraceae bacterium]|jgi:hypothetical protein|nr:hypothetical protein [Tepidisphaeraceae bacterium]
MMTMTRTDVDPRTLDPQSMLGRWQKFYQAQNAAIGSGGAGGFIGEEVTYDIAVPFLDQPGLLEDWGCGLCWAKRYVHHASYRGIDGTQTKFSDLVTDLRFYRPDPKPEFILMRHVLEHNRQWRKVLQNALDSFTRRMVLIIFTPFADQTHEIVFWPSMGVPDIGFKREDLTDLFTAAGCTFREESWDTNTQYQSETLFFLERNG